MLREQDGSHGCELLPLGADDQGLCLVLGRAGRFSCVSALSFDGERIAALFAICTGWRKGRG